MQEKAAYKKAYEVAAGYFRKKHPMRSGELFDNQGFIAYEETEGRTLNIICRIVNATQHIVLETEPQIHVSEPFLGQVSEYIAKINELIENHIIGIRKNGTIYMHTEFDYGNEPPTEKMLEQRERACKIELLTYSSILEKLANGRLLTSKEADAEAIWDDTFRLMLKTLVDQRGNEGNCNDN